MTDALIAQFGQLPDWLYRLAWSTVIVLASHLAGRVLARSVGQRLSQWAAKTAWKWDDLVIDALRRGVPVWSLLFGIYVASGFWQLPPHFQDVFNRLIYVCTWLSVTFLAAQLAGKLILLSSGPFQQALPVTSLTENIARILIVVLGLLMILHGMGVSIAPLLTALGVGGLAVALALQDTLSNLFAGFYLTVSRHVRLGDYIKLDSGEEGYVEDIGWRATKIRMLPNNTVLVPNKKLGEAIIINYELPSPDLAVTVDIGVAYKSDLAHVERVTCEVAKEVMQTVPGGIPTFEPAVRFFSFGDYSIKGTVVLRAKSFVDQYLLKHEFIKRLHVRYQREGITIPFPAQVVYKGEGS